MTTTTSKQVLQFIATMLAFLAMDLATAPLRAIGFVLASIVGFITLFGLEWLLIARRKYLSPRNILIASLIGFALINVPIRCILTWESTYVSFPDFLYRIAGILAGFWFAVAGKKVRWIIAGCCGVLLLLTNALTIRFYQFISFGSASGRVETPVRIDKIPTRDTEGNSMSLELDPDKTYVLYFCSEKCGVCHRKLPTFLEIRDRYRNRIPNVVFYAVDPLDNPADETFITRKSDLDLIFTTRDFAESIGIHGYPTVTVIRGNKQLYLGYTNPVENFLSKIH